MYIFCFQVELGEAKIFNDFTKKKKIKIYPFPSLTVFIFLICVLDSRMCRIFINTVEPPVNGHPWGQIKVQLKRGVQL